MIPSADSSKKLNFASLFLRISINLKTKCTGFRQMPFDFYCPSVQPHLKKRYCQECAKYFASMKSLKNHTSQVHKKSRQPKKDLEKIEKTISSDDADNDFDRNSTEFVDDDESKLISNNTEESEKIPVIKNIEEWLANDWEESE